jgi:hypothetical protein
MKKGESFAKIFETQYGQILFYCDYDPQEDQSTTHQVMTFDSVMVDVALNYKGENQEQKMREKFDNIDMSDAEIRAKTIFDLVDWCEE